MEDLKTDKATALDLIAQAITGDRVTPHLAQSATQLVFGAGNPDADVVFIGEAPGKNEDLRGEPFVRPASSSMKCWQASGSSGRTSTSPIL
jgi:uracil-DNA glycosylase